MWSRFCVCVSNIRSVPSVRGASFSSSRPGHYSSRPILFPRSLPPLRIQIPPLRGIVKTNLPSLIWRNNPVLTETVPVSQQCTTISFSERFKSSNVPPGNSVPIVSETFRCNFVIFLRLFFKKSCQFVFHLGDRFCLKVNESISLFLIIRYVTVVL